MKISLKHDLDVLEIDTTEQTYSFETYSKEVFDLLFYSDFNEAYFENKPNSTHYVGWGNYGDHGNEFSEVLIKNLGVWFSYYTETVGQFTKQVNHTIYTEAEQYYQIF